LQLYNVDFDILILSEILHGHLKFYSKTFNAVEVLIYNFLL